jgi:low affinity Fe/Cu permease
MSRDLIKDEQRKMRQDIVATEIKKENFIKEMVDGLGNEILQEPNKIQTVKKITFWDKIKKLF